MMKKAFTLAEVLIVLGIIGIVAAMTIPQLISNYHKAATVSQLKKTYSMLNQALKASIVDNGDVSEWDYVGSGEVIGEKYILPYLKVISKCPLSWTTEAAKNSSGTNSYAYQGRYGYYLVDGTVISFANYFPGNAYDWSMNHALGITVDLDGLKKGPNRVGHDVFTFLIPTEQSEAKNRHLNTVLPASYNYDSNDILKGNVSWGIGSCEGRDKTTAPYAGTGCAKVIMDDGWQITERYPWWQIGILTLYNSKNITTNS